MLVRTRIPELMDDPELDPALQKETLQGLVRLNAMSWSPNQLWAHIRKLRPEPHAEQPLRILDLATGAGDIPIGLWKRAVQEGQYVDIVGTDVNQCAVRFASERAQAEGARVRFEVLDVLSDSLPVGFDVIMTSMFTHHLDPPEVVELLGRMKVAAGRMVLVNDMIRSWLALLAVWTATRVFGHSRVLNHDGLVSVHASYTCEEFRTMADEAGLTNCEVMRLSPWRQLLLWRRRTL